ncbi:FecR family protein [Mucilaginibacter terrae]|uniref:Transmembrane sensor n=1 Tax=Mucilaginibacter terrae TaxID=1955052 RepID=A0ABU3GR30_9SPHI|nr:FecR domain-containing protein [Mucilaginibacter terrae]MDT3402239.1 transmembrane sensor [Mucilaginibacter terrae]
MKSKNDQKYIQEIAHKWANGEASTQEKEFYEKWYASFDDTDVELENSRFKSPDDLRVDIYNRLMAKVSLDKKAPSILVAYKKWFSAAAAILIIASGYWVFSVNALKNSSVQDVAQVHSIHPGKNTATLKLPNGQLLQLKDNKEGLVIDTRDLHYKDGSGINYAKEALAKQQEMVLSTPKGGTYQVVLPDGSKVWLNAQSSITLPANFATQFNRRLNLKGEAYFEIAKSQMHMSGKMHRRPFMVTVGSDVVEVLGTKFNIKSYAEEPAVKTTLLEGSVKFTSGKQQKIMLPGQQATANAEAITTTYVDVDEATAWKNGNFQFTEQKIQRIMFEIGRWYNVDVVYQGAISQESFGGTISRNKPITEVLASLEETGAVHFKIEGRRVIVMP